MWLQFFGDSGFACPTRRNPADHFLRCINSDFDDVTATLIGSRRINVRMVLYLCYIKYFFCSKTSEAFTLIINFKKLLIFKKIFTNLPLI